MQTKKGMIKDLKNGKKIMIIDKVGTEYLVAEMVKVMNGNWVRTKNTFWVGRNAFTEDADEGEDIFKNKENK